MPQIQRVGLFGTLTRTRVLLAIHMLGETHASELAEVLEISLSQAQRSLDSLERTGAIVGVMEGKARRVRLNPRYAYLKPLQALLGEMEMDAGDIGEQLAQRRRRPRRAGKEI